MTQLPQLNAKGSAIAGGTAFVPSGDVPTAAPAAAERAESVWPTGGIVGATTSSRTLIAGGSAADGGRGGGGGDGAAAASYGPSSH